MLHKWQGNIRELENLVERAILFSGDNEVLARDHFSFEMEPGKLETNQTENLALTSLSVMEKKMILVALKETKNNRTQAAKILEISVRTLRNKLNQYKSEGDTELAEFY